MVFSIVLLQCDVSVSELLRTYPEPLFYDVFVDLRQGEAHKLLAVPSLVLNQQYNGRYVNQGNLCVCVGACQCLVRLFSLFLCAPSCMILINSAPVFAQKT